MWDPPGPGIKPVSPALAGGFLTTAPPGKFLKKIIEGGGLPRRRATDLQDREPSPTAGAGPFLEIGGERNCRPGREITSRPELSLGLVADLGQMKGNRRPVCKRRSGVQEIISFDRSMYRKFKFCLRIHKLGAFLF